ncbi:MAG: DUF2062 domain-containing protein [Deltaproteobacteria bacterium]|nr:DUF2062 domain-containing protein [Deltaproteobacteria bacterium]
MPLRKAWARFRETFLSLRGSPNYIAFSFAVGMVIAFCPFFGLHTVLSAIVAIAFRLNFPATYLAAWLSNPLTIAFFLAAEYETGRVFLGWERVRLPHSEITIDALKSTGWSLIAPLLIGWAILGMLSGVASFPLVRGAIIKARSRKSEPNPETGP